MATVAPAGKESSDEAISRALGQLGSGDRTGLATLYRLTAAKLFGVCLRICRDHQAAEDILNEVYLTVWRQRVPYDPGRGRALAWLCTMARNRSIDWVRRNGRPTMSDAVLRDMPSDEIGPEEAAANAQESGRLHLCIEGLKSEQREAIRTAFFDGVTYAELAARQGVPLGTMKTWVRRGLGKLKDCLNG